MKIQSINTNQQAYKQNFGAHFNFTSVGKKFVSDLEKCMRKENILKYTSRMDHRQGLVKRFDNLLDSDMVITLNKLENDKYHGVLSKRHYQADFEFDNYIKKDGEGEASAQLDSMYSALKSAAEHIKNSKKSFFEAMKSYLPLK